MRVRLLMVEVVQKDLCLTAAQIARIKAFVKTSEARWQGFLAQSREAFPPSQFLPSEEFEDRMQEFRTLSDHFEREKKESRTKVLAILTPDQTERLKQIHLQVSIPATLRRPEIVKALGISEEQREKIRTVCNQIDQKELAEWPDLRDSDREKRRQRLIEFAKSLQKAEAEGGRRLLQVLTPEQRTQLEKLQGDKIDLTRLYEETWRLGEGEDVRLFPGEAGVRRGHKPEKRVESGNDGDRGG